MVDSFELPVFDSVDEIRVLVELSPIPMVVWDAETLRIIAAGAAASDLYGWSPDELCAMTVAELRPSEDMASFLVQVRPFIGDPADLASGSRVASSRHLSADGSVHYVTATSRRCIVAGRSSCVTAVRDETDRVLAERAREEAIFALAGLGERVRSSVATRLHDGPVQVLTAASLRIGMMRRDRAVGDDPRLAEIERLVILALQDVRREMDDHRAPAEMSSSLSSSLRQLLHRHDLHDRIDLMVGGPEPSPPLAASIYRLVQSLVTERLLAAGTIERPRPLMVNVTATEVELTLPVQSERDVIDRVASFGRALGATFAEAGDAALQAVVVRVPAGVDGEMRGAR